MRVIEIREFGAADVLQLSERAMPVPKENEVLIKVHAAGLNRPDILQRQGHYPPPEGASDIPGLEVAGEIVESKSSEWRVGDHVCALLTGGGYAEYAIAPAGQCLSVPKSLDMVEAAALPETVFTVWNNLFYRGKLQSGETVLVHGGSSGIGTIAIQMAKTAKAHVIITAGSDEKCAACIDLGADQAINYKTHDFLDAIGENSVDIVLDMVGGDYIPKNLKLLKTDGRHVNIAHLGGAKTEINIRTIMIKRLILTGSTLRPRSIEEKTLLRDQIRENIWPHIKNAKIKPVIFKTFPMTEAIAAHEALENGDHIGKIVLDMR